MARLTPAQREQARNDYEVHNMGIREIARKWNVSPATVSSWAKSDEWEQGKTEHLIEKKKNAIKDLYETEQQTKHCSASVQLSINNEVQKRLEAEQIFVDAAKYNQMVANELLQNSEELSMTTLDTHSRLTHRNKETVLGKQPDTAIQINNNEDKRPIINLKLNE